MNIPLDEAEVQKLNARLRRVCDELHEMGASAVLVMVSYSEQDENGVVGSNRSHFRDGNFFESLGLMEAVRQRLLKEAVKD